MKKLKQQISESFFNPILYFLPLLVFIIGNNIWGLNFAWKISFPIAMFLLVYVYYFYNRLFLWYIVLAESYIFIGLIYSLAQIFNLTAPLYHYTDDILLVLMLAFLLLTRKKICLNARKAFFKRMPMSNNLDELFRVVFSLLIVMTFFTTMLLLLFQYEFIAKYHALNNIYIAVIILLIVYEFIRVFYIRNRLIKEKWVPIVSKQGNVIGREVFSDKIFGGKKHMHPVVRMHIIDQGKILLHRHAATHSIDPFLWDVAIDTHVRVSETIYQALEREVKLRYGATLKKTIFLSNYSHETELEFEYVYLFVSCKLSNDDLTIAQNSVQSKWWVRTQINENIESGIFTEEFKREYKLLERSGLISSPSCICDCELKDIFVNQKITNNPKNAYIDATTLNPLIN